MRNILNKFKVLFYNPIIVYLILIIGIGVVAIQSASPLLKLIMRLRMIIMRLSNYSLLELGPLSRYLLSSLVLNEFAPFGGGSTVFG